MDKKNLILIVASIGTFVESLDIAIINLTIPSIQQQFKLGTETAQWLQTLYVLFFGGFLIIGGKLSDQIGRKKIYISGIVIFMLTSLGAGLSSNFQVLAGFRALQGLGAAFIMPSAMSIVINTFKKDQERNRAVGIFSSFAAIGSGSGLSLGGIISTYLSWHWVFLINVPILFLTLIFAYKYLPKDNTVEKGNKTDITSGILLVLGLLSLTYGTHELIHIKEQTLVVITSLVLAILCILFVLYRLRSASQPLIDLNLLKHKSLLISNITFLALGAFYIGFLFLISLMLQKDMNHSAASAGLMLVPFSILSALVAKFILPIISQRINATQLGVLGWFSMLIGSVLLISSLYLEHSLTLVLTGAAFISGIGMTFCFTALSVMGIQDIKPSDYGVASSLGTTNYFLGAGLGLSFMTLINQIYPSELAVGNISLMIMIGYVLFALITLLFYSPKIFNRKCNNNLLD